MKVKDLVVKVPTIKPRNLDGHNVLAQMRKVSGRMKDKKQAEKRGESPKHKSRAYEDITLEAKAKREAIPKMVYPGVKVSMLQDWQRKLGPAIRKLGYTPDMAGYEDGSTTWSVAFHIDKKFDKAGFEDKLRDELDMGGWMQVKFFDMVEEDEELSGPILAEGRANVYGPGDDFLTSHSNKMLKALGDGPVKVLTRSGIAKIMKVQARGSEFSFKLDREVLLNDGSKGEWVDPADVTTSVSEIKRWEARTDSKTVARKRAEGSK